MRPADSFRPVLGRIDSLWTPENWDQFNSSRVLLNPLTFLHEATHWYQHRCLVSHTLTLLTVRALKYLDEPIARTADLDKVIAARKSLAPISEGLALYAQYDYFPANYYAYFGPHTTFDALVEFAVRRDHKYMKEADRHSEGMYTLQQNVQFFYESARLSAEALRSKRGQLYTPFLVGEAHITGYIFVKEIVARIRRFSRFTYIHDGLIVRALTSFFFDCPLLVNCLLDDACVGPVFLARVREILSAKLDFLLSDQISETFFQLSRSNEAEGAVDSFPLEQSALQDAWQVYSKHFDREIGDHLRSSVARWIRAGETIDDYLERYSTGDERLPYPLSSHRLTYAANVVKFFHSDVTIFQKNDGNFWITLSNGRSYSIDELGECSPRIESYGWLKLPSTRTEGRLIDCAFEMFDEYHRVVFIDWSGGLLTLSHNTQDENIGYEHIGGYLQNSFRIDAHLSEIDERLSLYEAGRSDFVSTVEKAVKELYLRRITRAPEMEIMRCFRTAPDSHSNIADIFESKVAINSYIALSLIVRLYDFTHEDEQSVAESIDTYAGRFSPEPIDVALMKKLVRSRQLSYVQERQGRPVWWSFGCYL